MSLKTVSSAILDHLADMVVRWLCCRAIPSATQPPDRHTPELYELPPGSTRTCQLNYNRRQRDLTLEKNHDEAHLPTDPGSSYLNANDNELTNSLSVNIHFCLPSKLLNL